MSTTINFYKVHGEKYGCFSNFSPHSVELDGKTWKTTEHYYQAQKFPDDPTYQEEIRLARGPRKAAEMGRNWLKRMRPDWDEVKDKVMLTAVLAKFRQNPDIKDILLETGDATLVEHTANDRYWGDGGDGTGKNMLGKVLMTVREVLV